MRGEVRAMSKLIYADSLRQDILDLPNCYNGFSDTYDKACIIGVIDEQQPVDAVPVIRCKDCKWFGEIGCAIRIVDDSDKPKEDDYCSFAERRSDDGV